MIKKKLQNYLKPLKILGKKQNKRSGRASTGKFFRISTLFYKRSVVVFVKFAQLDLIDPVKEMALEQSFLLKPQTFVKGESSLVDV